MASSPDEPVTAHYAAIFSVNISAYDATVVFGTPRAYISAPGALPDVKVDWCHSVSMSLRAAKELRDLLAQQIAQFEKNYGEIPMPQIK